MNEGSSRSKKNAHTQQYTEKKRAAERMNDAFLLIAVYDSIFEAFSPVFEN